MTSDQSIGLLVFALVAAITPGPSNVMITATAAAVGIRRGLPCALGAAVGMAILLFAAALGFGRLVAAAPEILAAAKWCGAAFLLWLAWRITTAGRSTAGGAARPVGFLGAAAFQWVNPKGWLVAIGAAGTYLPAAADSPLRQALVFATLFFVAAFPAMLVWLLFGALLQRFLAEDRSARIFNAAMGLMLAASVIVMLR